MYNKQDILELVELGSYGSFPLQGLSTPRGFQSYMSNAGTIELELVEQNSQQLCA